jgi:TonB family protein
VQIVATSALLIYTVLAPRLEPALARHIALVAPDLTAPVTVAEVKPLRPAARPQPLQISLPVPPKIQPPPVQLQQPQRVHRVAPVEEVAQPKLTAAPKFDSKLLKLPESKSLSKIVATNTFTGSSAAPTLQKVAPSKVQTGGFGDPNGVAANPRSTGKSNIAAVGSFDVPPGSGSGNGTGGASGARGTVASAGFGNTVAVQAAGRAQAHIQTTTFAIPSAAEEHHAKVSDLSNPVPVSIQSKPTPAYTPEARQLRIEGEVLLSVVFTADGHVRILNVVRGLGHGLDEAAQRAAQGVKFSPAMRNGHPVDSNATLHIVFQLS